MCVRVTVSSVSRHGERQPPSTKAEIVFGSWVHVLNRLKVTCPSLENKPSHFSAMQYVLHDSFQDWMTFYVPNKSNCESCLFISIHYSKELSNAHLSIINFDTKYIGYWANLYFSYNPHLIIKSKDYINEHKWLNHMNETLTQLKSWSWIWRQKSADK